MTKTKFGLWLLLCWGILLMPFLANPTVTQGATQDKVLLVYDSKNVASQGDEKIDGLQRLLTSLNLKVTTLRMHAYQKGTLTAQHYTGVITVINWPQTEIPNPDFETDRKNFTGRKLHIGDNLDPDELAGLQSQAQAVYHEQFYIKTQGQEQLLPFSQTMTALTDLPNQAQGFGSLVSQEITPHTFNYGTIVDQNGYLPYFTTNGLSFILAAQTIAQLFQKAKTTYPPMLTITGVTPYTNLQRLSQLTSALYKRGIPFAISTTNVDENTNMTAYYNFMKVLRQAENQGGVILLRTPTATGPTVDSGPELSRLMQSYLVNMGQQDVFPVGFSTPGYWNQDATYQQYALQYANYVLLLPDPKTPAYIKQTDRSMAIEHGIFGLTLNQLTTIESTENLPLFTPTAITLNMPETKKGVQGAVRKIEGLAIDWLDPATHDLQAKIEAGSITYQYSRGLYYLNGRQVEISENPTKWRVPREPLTIVGQLNRFFKLQSNILLIIFSVVFVVLIVFIFLGRRIYKRMFINKS